MATNVHTYKQKNVFHAESETRIIDICSSHMHTHTQTHALSKTPTQSWREESATTTRLMMTIKWIKIPATYITTVALNFILFHFRLNDVKSSANKSSHWICIYSIADEYAACQYSTLKFSCFFLGNAKHNQQYQQTQRQLCQRLGSMKWH